MQMHGARPGHRNGGAGSEHLGKARKGALRAAIIYEALVAEAATDSVDHGFAVRITHDIPPTQSEVGREKETSTTTKVLENGRCVKRSAWAREAFATACPRAAKSTDAL